MIDSRRKREGGNATTTLPTTLTNLTLAAECTATYKYDSKRQRTLLRSPEDVSSFTYCQAKWPPRQARPATLCLQQQHEQEAPTTTQFQLQRSYQQLQKLEQKYQSQEKLTQQRQLIINLICINNSNGNEGSSNRELALRNRASVSKREQQGEGTLLMPSLATFASLSQPSTTATTNSPSSLVREKIAKFAQLPSSIVLLPCYSKQKQRCFYNHLVVILTLFTFIMLTNCQVPLKLPAGVSLAQAESSVSALGESQPKVESVNRSLVERSSLSNRYNNHGANEDGGGGEDDSGNPIPGAGDAGGATTTTTTTTSTTRRPAVSQQQRRTSALRVTESELLPFADFNVQQPAFSDLMRSWPPTTLQSAARAHESSEALEASRRQHAEAARQRYLNMLQQQQAANRHYPQQAAGSRSYAGSSAHSDGEDDSSRPMRNRLNEDFDDTIVTADQSFDADQAIEPPTWTNYLGEFGDYIYSALLRQSSERQLVSSKATSTDQQQPTTLDGQQQQLSAATRTALEALEDLIDDYYYHQYENSQVLYYGPQLVREGDIFEIGCYLPNDHPAEWTKSGRPLANRTASSPRAIRRSDFLGAKQNYSLKIFEASLADSGNYKCNRMSRKYHKLVVVPLKATTTQLYVIQQRLLSVVNPKLMSAYSPSLFGAGTTFSPPPTPKPQLGASQQQIQRFGQAPSSGRSSAQGSTTNSPQKQQQHHTEYLLPGYMIVEGLPLIVNCNITDEFVLRQLRDNPQFGLAWYKNGKQLRGSMVTPYALSSSAAGPNQSAGSNYNSNSHNYNAGGGGGGSSRSGNRYQQRLSGGQSFQRIQFLQANGRQLYIPAPTYGDAGDYLCSWSKLPVRQSTDFDDNASSAGESSYSAFSLPAESEEGSSGRRQQATFSGNPLAAGTQFQLLAPTKLRPFKSTYHVQRGNELRLVCQIQRGYPAAQISWYVGNRLVDGEFLREHADEYKLVQLQSQSPPVTSPPWPSESSPSYGDDESPSSGPARERRRLVEINPIPVGMEQMQVTSQSEWLEYYETNNEMYAFDTPDQQLRYLRRKLARLAESPTNSGAGGGGGGRIASITASGTSLPDSPMAAVPAAPHQQQQTSLADGDPAGSLYRQAGISVLVIRKLDIERHTSRYACRATTRSNTDEVTTVIRVQATSTITTRPSSGRATLIPGQSLHFQCDMVDNNEAQFLWYRRSIGQVEGEEQLLDPAENSLEINNERLTIHKPTNQLAGDYICRALSPTDKSPMPSESATIKVRTQPYIEDFGLDTSHTGKSGIVTHGDRLELTCTVRNSIHPVNITWLRSMTPDDERTMVPLLEGNSGNSGGALQLQSRSPQQGYSPSAQISSAYPLGEQAFIAPDQNIVIESIGNDSKRLIIESVKHEHRSYYVCLADNGVTERTRKIIFVRVKDKLVALWPFLGIVAELFILFTIIHVWETQRAYKEIHSSPPSVGATGASSAAAVGASGAGSGSAINKRPASGASIAFENVPLTSGSQ